MSERRMKVQGSLSTLAAVYGDHSPRLNVSSADRQPDVQRGDTVTVFDTAGNEVAAEVVGVEFVVAPRMDTLRNPRKEARQTALGIGDE